MFESIIPIIDAISPLLAASLGIFGIGYIVAAWCAKEDIVEIKYTCSAIFLYVLAQGIA